MASGTITRSVTFAQAYAWRVEGNNPDGSPHMERIGNIDFYATSPTQTDAFRALKAAGVKVRKDFVSFDILKTEVYAMDLDTFVHYGVPVERMKNGRVIMPDSDADADADMLD